MNLLEYRTKFRIFNREIAEKCNCTPEMISLITKGKTRPSFELALLIERATNGQVGRENWYPSGPKEITITIGGLSL